MHALIMLLIFLNSLVSTTSEVRFKHKTTVLDKIVYLSDLVKKDINPSLGVIPLSKSPLPGRFKYVYSGEVKRSLLKAGIKNLGKYKIPRRIKVFRAGRKVGRKELMIKVSEVLKRILPDAVFASIYVGVNGFTAPLGVLRFEAVSKEIHPDRGRWNGKIIVKLGNETVKEFSVGAVFGIFKKVPVASHNLLSGKVLGAKDIKFKKIDITKYQKPVLNTALLNGAVLVRNVKAGSPFVKYSVKPKKLVFKNHKVRILVKLGNIRAKAYGIALDNGALGSVVRIRNIRSRKIIKARVISRNEVEVADFRK